MTLKHKIYQILEENPTTNRLSQIVRLSIIFLIFINVLAVILETVEIIHVRYSFYFDFFEILSVIIFTIEYLLRVWSSSINEQFKGIKGRLKFIFTPFALIDLFAILPFYLPFLVVVDLRFIRAVRLIRIFRILKIGRYSESLSTIVRVIKDKKEELLMTLFTIMVLLVIASSLMFYFEHDAQPKEFSSIPATMWWGLITLTTVGYGDMYPITMAGKLLGGVLAILGVGMFALPAAILASAFSKEIKKNKDAICYCPHCGKDLEHS